MQLDIDARLIERIHRLRLVVFDFDGVFTDNMVYVLQDGTEAVRCSRADGFGLRRLEHVGIEPIVISTEKNPVVIERCRKLQIRCINGCDDKVSVLQDVLAERKLSFEQTAFVGNDINDLGCLEKVSVPIVVQDAHVEVLAVALYRTINVGGHGAVREICDLIYNIRKSREA